MQCKCVVKYFKTSEFVLPAIRNKCERRRDRMVAVGLGSFEEKSATGLSVKTFMFLSSGFNMRIVT